MKKLIIVFICVLLCSCNTSTNIRSSIDEVLSVDNQIITLRRNNYADYIDYYLPSDVYEYSCDKLAYTFNYDESRIVMDINIPGILNSEYYPNKDIVDEGFFDKNKLVYKHTSTYLDMDNNPHDYFLNIYEYRKQYLVYFVSRELVFYGYCDEKDLIQVCSKIILIAKSSSVKNEDVLANYSTKDVIDYEKKNINLFETIMPVNGDIHDFLVDGYSIESDE